MGSVDKDVHLAEKIKAHQDRCHQTYGYRRMHLWLESQGIHHNPKTVLRIMKKYGILSEIRRKRKWQNLGQQIHRYRNLLNRQFSADRPNSKWVTDISYIQTKEGVLYLSMIRDLYDKSIVAYKTATQQTVNLVLDTIRLAMKKEKKRVAAGLQFHSNQGFQYTSQAYFKLYPLSVLATEYITHILGTNSCITALYINIHFIETLSSHRGQLGALNIHIISLIVNTFCEFGYFP